MDKIRIGYLPLYIKLYDDSEPEAREPMVAYTRKLIGMLEAKGFEVVVPDDICRVKEEFQQAAAKFNAEPDIAAVVTQHLAYSPSLESIDALVSLKAPIIVLDTTPDYELLRYADTEKRIMNNHGIHGVQDMCNMLLRRGKAFELCAGHAEHSGVIDEVSGLCRAFYAARKLKECRVGMVGGEFEGMGDFRVPEAELEAKIGFKTIKLGAEEGRRYAASVTDAELARELDADKENYEIEATQTDNYIAATRAGLAFRKWMTDNQLDGVTVNFMHIDESGLAKMPFVECCKTLARGLGYAGEGDNLTAALVSALMKAYPATTFTEMFCPDWERDVILMSHMGELNPTLTAGKPLLIDMPFNYNDTGDTVALAGCFREGSAVLVNLAPTAEGFSLILVPVKLLGQLRGTKAYDLRVRGWLKPPAPLPEFLKAYSLAGGTHHSALVYDATPEELAAFGRMLGFKVVTL